MGIDNNARAKVLWSSIFSICNGQTDLIWNKVLWRYMPVDNSLNYSDFAAAVHLWSMEILIGVVAEHGQTDDQQQNEHNEGGKNQSDSCLTAGISHFDCIRFLWLIGFVVASLSNLKFESV